MRQDVGGGKRRDGMVGVNLNDEGRQIVSSGLTQNWN